MSLVAGYLAVTGSIDLGAILLFLIMVFWQLPHFFAIGIFRLNDYKEAGIPILPVEKGIGVTKIYIVIFMTLYLISLLLLSLTGYTGLTFLVVMVTLATVWLGMGLRGFRAMDDVRWARKLFSFSLILLLTFSVLLSLNVVLP